MSEQSTENTIQTAKTYIVENRGWFITLGICLIILGAIAIIFPFVATIAVKIFLGWIFLVVGVVQIIHAFRSQKWSGFGWSMLVGLLYLVAGGWLAFFPLAGIVTLTILLSALFIAQGVMEALLALRMRPDKGWGWVLFSGLIALAVGVMIFIELPGSAVWAIGLLAGINMISSGFAYVFIAQAAKEI